MKTWKKVVIGVGVVAVAGGMVAYTMNQANRDVVTVQTGKVAEQDITSVVTASGEIRPKTYANVLGEGMGKIVEVAVKEGDTVRRSDVLLRLESIQPSFDVDAQQAALSSAQAAVRSAEASYRSALAEQAQRAADFQRAKFDWERAQGLFKEELISKQEFDARKASFDASAAAMDVVEARLGQTRADVDRSRSQLQQTQAVLSRSRDVLRKTTYTAPIEGIVTYVAVRVGENVVPGIQNSPGSYLMTISDMSVVTAEVRVDETDIVNVRVGQDVDVTVDAIPGRVYQARVSEVGTQAVFRTSGMATTQTTTGSQEARDFKVVVTLLDPPETVRPGLSTTAKIKTAARSGALAIPMQALAVRTRQELEDAEKEQEGKKDRVPSVALAAAKAAPGADPKKEEIQGVFVIDKGHAVFTPVETGITGITEIEVTSGLSKEQEIVTGSYRALRSLRHGARVKVDNQVVARDQSR